MSDTINKKEKITLEYALSDRELFLKAHSVLKPSYFERPLDAVVEYALEYFSNYHKIPDFDLIEAETNVSLKYRDVDDSDRQYAVDEIEHHCAKQAMVEAILKSADLVNDDEVDLTQVQTLVRDALMVKIDKVLGTDLFESPRERRERSELNVDGKLMGIPALDEIAEEWRRGELYFFVAGTSVGKSVMLGNVAERFSSQKEDVMIYSVEMNEDLYSKRLDSIVTGTPIKEPDVDEIVDYLESNREDYGRITTKKVNTKFGVEDLRAHLLEYHMTYGKYPDVCIIDYIDIFGTGAAQSKNMNKYDIDEHKTHSIRDLMDEFGMRGFTAAQMNRDGYGLADIGPQHVQGGLSKLQGADGAFALVATEEDLENDQLQCKGIKLRNSNNKHKVITLYRCPKTLRVTDEPLIPKQKNPLDKRKADKDNGGPSNTPKKTTSKSTSKKDLIKDTPKSGKDKLKQAMSLSRGL